MQALVRHALMLVVLLAVTACSAVKAPSKADPFESFNRSMDAFNQQVDNLAVKPVARAYLAVVPEVVRMGVSNFFSNLADVLVGLNNLLQGKPTAAASDFGRVAINSTIGVLGLFDVASDMGLKKNNEDFGQTLGKWGAGPGPYLVLPLFGPSSVRDAFGVIVDRQADITVQIDDVSTRNGLFAARLVNRRAELLDLTDSVEGVALDPYAFVRDAYLANRRNRVYDGDPPNEFVPDEEDADAPRP